MNLQKDKPDILLAKSSIKNIGNELKSIKSVTLNLRLLRESAQLIHQMRICHGILKGGFEGLNHKYKLSFQPKFVSTFLISANSMADIEPKTLAMRELETQKISKSFKKTTIEISGETTVIS